MHRVLAHKRLVIGLIVLVVCLAVVAILAARGFIGAWLGDYAANAQITSIAIRDISLRELTVDITFSVENPNPVGATIDRLAYDIYYLDANGEWVYLGKGDMTEDVAIGANDAVSLEVPNEIRTLSTIRMVRESIREGTDITVKAVGSAWVKVGPLVLEVPFERSLGAGSPSGNETGG
jgi:LEA14-like dessication related protein